MNTMNTMNANELEKFITNKNIIIDTFTEKHKVAYQTADDALKELNLQVVKYICDNIESDIKETFEKRLFVSVSHNYLNINLKLSSDPNDWNRLACISISTEYRDGSYVPYCELTLELNSRFKENNVDIEKFKLYYSVLNMFNTPKHLAAIKEYMARPSEINKESYEISSIINVAKDEIETAKLNFKRLAMTRLVFTGSEIEIAREGKEAYFGRNSRRSRNGVYYNKIVITKITPTKITVSFKRRYANTGDMAHVEAFREYEVLNKKLGREELDRILVSNSESIIELNGNKTKEIVC